MSARCWGAAGLLALAGPVEAFDLGERLAVTEVHGPRVFHHVASAGRKNVAAAGGTVAVVWEDNRSGRPEVYLALKPPAAGRFGEDRRVSGGEEAAEPTVAALGGGRFLVAWEEGGGVWLRVVSAEGAGAPLQLSGGPARQATLAAAGEGAAHAVWAESGPTGQVVRYAKVRLSESAEPRPGPTVPVDPSPSSAYQAYPSVAGLAEGGSVVAWEDRRHGHTRIYSAHSGTEAEFGPARALNEYRAPPSEAGGAPSRLGSGVMRPVLARAGGVVAVWLDKRDVGSGYAVWGARSSDGGASFGPNEKVQDDSGGSQATPHWNVAVAGHPEGGVVVVAWDDAREAWSDPEETGDVCLTWSTGAGWSGDRVVPAASGPGRQAEPSVALDEAGALHLVWVEQERTGGPSRLWYARGVLPASP